MQDNHEMMDLNEHLTDAEIMRTIRYLDPDLYAQQVGEGPARLEISFTLVAVLTGALVYIGLYVRTL